MNNQESFLHNQTYVAEEIIIFISTDTMIYMNVIGLLCYEDIQYYVRYITK